MARKTKKLKNLVGKYAYFTRDKAGLVQTAIDNERIVDLTPNKDYLILKVKGLDMIIIEDNNGFEILTRISCTSCHLDSLTEFKIRGGRYVS